MTENVVTKSAWPRISRALSLLALGVALIMSVALPGMALLMGETPRANFAFALIVISVLVALAVLSSYGASLRIQQMARIAWLTVAVACLVFAQYVLSLDYPDAPKTADNVLVIVMYLLAFPAGNIAAGFFFVSAALFPSGPGIDWWDLVVLWAVFLVLGYLQWFKLLPWLIEKRRARRASQV